MNHCDFCGTDLIDNRCPSCDLYNAAVSAIQAAAQRIVRNRGGDPKEPCWVNEYGIFGWRDGKCVQMGTPEEAAGPIFFLASPLSDYVSGQCIEIAGGF